DALAIQPVDRSIEPVAPARTRLDRESHRAQPLDAFPYRGARDPELGREGAAPLAFGLRQRVGELAQAVAHGAGLRNRRGTRMRARSKRNSVPCDRRTRLSLCVINSRPAAAPANTSQASFPGTSQA